MKKYIIILIAILFTSEVYSQDYVAHQYQANVLQLSFISTTQDKMGGEFGYSFVNGNRATIRAKIGYEFDSNDVSGTTEDTYFLSGTYLVPLLTANRNFISFGAGAYFGYEYAVNSTLDLSKDAFTGGVLITPEYEFYITPKFGLFVGAEGMYRFNSIYSDFLLKGVAGLRIVL